MLGHLKHYVGQGDTLAPVLSFQALVGLVSTGIANYLLTCGQYNVCTILGHQIMQPTPVTFTKLPCLAISSQLQGLPLLRTYEATSKILNSTFTVPKNQQKPEEAASELIENLRGFFADALPTLYSSDLNISGVTIKSENYNFYVNAPIISQLEDAGIPCVHFIQGDVFQTNLNQQTISIITRQNALHVGTRFNARGLNEFAAAANEYEHELVYETQAGYFLSQVILRGSVPILWRSDASLIKNDFVLLENYDRLSSVYWGRTVQQYQSCYVLNLLRKAEQQKRVQSSPSISNVPPTEEADSSSNEAIICEAFKQSITNQNRLLAIQHKEIKYNNFQWHEELKVIKTTVKEWFKNDGNITTAQGRLQSGMNVKDCGCDSSTEQGRAILKLRENQTYISQMLALVKILQSLNEEVFDVSVGTIQAGKIDIVSKQTVLLRVNCADSLDRTNLAVFHLTQVLNLIITQFIATQSDKIIKAIENQKNEPKICQTTSLFSVKRRQKQEVHDQSDVVKQIFCNFQKHFLGQFKPLKDSSESRILYVSLLEQSLFTSSLYSELAQAFFKIANVLSMIYTGTDAAHQDIMGLFCDIQIQSNSMVAIKRRITAQSNKDRQKNEAKTMLAPQGISQFLLAKPLCYLADSSEQQYPKSYFQLLWNVATSTSNYNFLRDLCLSEPQNALSSISSDELFGRITSTQCSSHLVASVQGLLALVQMQSTFQQDTQYFVQHEYFDLQVFLKKLMQLSQRVEWSPFHYTYCQQEALPSSCFNKLNLTQFLRTNRLTDENRMNEMLKLQVQMDYCPVSLAQTMGFVQQDVEYALGRHDADRTEELAQLLGLTSGRRSLYVLDYEFERLVSLTDIVVVVPRQSIGPCCPAVELMGTDENGIEFQLEKLELPDCQQHEQQLHFRPQRYQPQSNSAILSTISALELLFDGGQPVDTIACYPRLKRLEIVFRVEATTKTLPKVLLFGCPRQTRSQASTLLGQFNRTVMLAMSAQICDKLLKIGAAERITWPLFALQSYFRHSYRDQRDVIKIIFDVCFEGINREAIDKAIGDGFVLHCYALKLNVPVYYLRSIMLLLNMDRTILAKLVTPTLNVQQHSQEIYSPASVSSSSKMIFEPMLDSVLTNQQTAKQLASFQQFCSRCGKKEPCTFGCQKCRNNFCKGCMSPTLIPFLNMLDFARAFVVCQRCYDQENQLQKTVGEFIRLQQSQKVEIFDYASMYEQKDEDKLVVTCGQQTEAVVVEFPNRITLLNECISLTKHQFYTQAVLKPKKSLELKFTPPPRRDEVNVSFRKQPPSLLFINLEALQTAQKQQPITQLQPFDQCSSSENGVQTFSFVFKDRVQVAKLQVSSTNFALLQIKYMSPHESDDFLREKKKPGKQTKAKQNAECQALSLEQIQSPENMTGQKAVTWQLCHQYQSHRVNVEVIGGDVKEVTLFG